MISNEIIFFSAFLAFILGMLLLDLGVFSRKNHIVSFKEAGIWSAVWITFALIFYFIIRTHGDLIHGVENFDDLKVIQQRYAEEITLYPDDFERSLESYRSNMALEFITGYLVEYALSVDNIFVIIMIFTSFGVREKYYKKVLFWGILGALIMRFLFIFAASSLILKAGWVLYLFGAFLVFTGVQMYLNRNKEDKIEPQEHPVVKFASRYFAVVPRYVNDRFFVRKRGKLMLTPLFVVVLIIEFTDLIFAVDSVPAVFAVTTDPYVVFFSNIFAIMGLRSMFFFLANVMHLFHYLKVGLAVLLMFIGTKMLAHSYLKEIGFKTQYSLYIIIGILLISVLASLVFPAKPKEDPEQSSEKPSSAPKKTIKH
ncbi:TerC/Alx family metal homeostasis membrane protein [Rhodocytophaga rosea]|uniref:TerC/Alx family metal homeostasis membrane protein n=1 Tax=Rhodocytophaga rosea TaxID=2704465 RepID=A0A6C0GIF6_9BACT|nr:TerC/Alx family metal homeostasis membrane protein [Rhodocytophaga rosea]QHT67510.1 TerC/Alx family metal homeostasis membrane protein [Rhodocytophaga rosea]